MEDWSKLSETHAEFLSQLTRQIITNLTEARSSLQLGNSELFHLSTLLQDPAFLLRFAKKNKFNINDTLANLLAHIDWRLDASIQDRCVELLDEQPLKYLNDGLFYFWGFDKQGIPLCILNFSVYKHTTEIDSLRIYLILMMEISRKYICDINTQNPSSLVVQICVLVDLSKFSMKDFSYDLIPTFYDLFHNHFPQVIGTVYVLNFSWLHSGVWSVVKRALPVSATSKVVFLSSDQISDYIPLENLPTELGGTSQNIWSSQTCPILNKYGCRSNASREPNSIFEQLKPQVKSLSSSPSATPTFTFYSSPVTHSDIYPLPESSASILFSEDDDERYSQTTTNDGDTIWFDALEDSMIEDMNIMDSIESLHQPKRTIAPQQLLDQLRIPLNRDAMGLQTLPRPPSSKSLSSLLTMSRMNDDAAGKAKKTSTGSNKRRRLASYFGLKRIISVSSVVAVLLVLGYLIRRRKS